MLLHDTTLATPELNLALDEALLLDTDGAESLRLWESPSPLVVLGRSSRVEEEVDLAACAGVGAPVLRRVSGGATIVTGPGCLMYAVTLDTKERPELRTVDRAHRYGLDRIADALRPFDPTTAAAGTSDLTVSVDGTLSKFSGNSVRLVRSRLLYHGTLMYGFELGLIARLLRTPPRQPDYRRGRSHRDFVTNLPATRDRLAAALTSVWDATASDVGSGVLACAGSLVAEKYGRHGWNHSR